MLTTLPTLPGERPLPHEQQTWTDAEHRVLSNLDLLGVAQGEEPRENIKLRDRDLDKDYPVPAAAGDGSNAGIVMKAKAM